ncbi:MAG: hypothetical protein FWE14_12590, partial [Lachnospiraceae bacterium]|nr:hypothetical protein [Lachnospiraceae bacterium]
PRIKWEETPFYLPKEISEWNKISVDEELQPRRGAVSSFGAGGVNAHVIIEEFCTLPERGKE